jgi:hypothetical protein
VSSEWIRWSFSPRKKRRLTVDAPAEKPLTHQFVLEQKKIGYRFEACAD